MLLVVNVYFLEVICTKQILGFIRKNHCLYSSGLKLVSGALALMSVISGRNLWILEFGWTAQGAREMEPG